MAKAEDIAALYDQARAAHQAGDARSALVTGLEMEGLAPGDPRTWIVLGQAALALGDFKAAAKNLMLLLEKDPENAGLRTALTQALAEIGYFEEAAESYRPVFEASPEALEKYTYFGNLCALAGRADDAVACFDKARQMAPGNPDILAALAWAFVQKGDFDAAKGLVGEVLERDPAHVRALVIRADLEPGAMTAPEIAALDGLADSETAHLGMRIDAAFAAAKGRQGGAPAEETFAAFAKANALAGRFFAGRGAVYDEARDKAEFEAVTALYTRAVVAGGAPAKGGAVPVFVIGLPRSGTTLVEQILASHPKVHGGGESKVLGELHLRVMDIAARTGRAPAKILSGQRAEWREEYLARLTAGSAAPVCVTDKMPLNYPYVGLARALFPEAKFIFLVRDPLDTCLSMYFQPLSDSYPASVSLSDLGCFYRRFEAYLSHWRAVLEDGIFDLAYEELVEDPEATTRKLIDFLGLPWDDACLEFYNNPRPVRTLSNVQVRKPISKEGVGRWKKYEQHLGPLKKALGP